MKRDPEKQNPSKKNPNKENPEKGMTENKHASVRWRSDSLTTV